MTSGPDPHDIPVDAALGITREERWLADALAGSEEALETLARRDSDGAIARRHRAGASLYLRAARRGFGDPAVAVWHRELLAMAARHLQARSTVEEIAGLFGEPAIEWTPIKGYDVATRVYDAPEERPTADIDLLIRPERLDDARRALEAGGWEGTYRGPRNWRFLREEGYAWMAYKPGRTFLEIHFRLWGLVPDGFAEALFDRSRPEASLPPGGRRLALPDAYLLAAVHEWLSPPPRHLVSWWDLARISDRLSPADVEEVLEGARRWDLHLPVALASQVSEALWGREPCREIGRRLAAELRAPERWLAAWARRHGLVGLSLSHLQAARLAARRRSRQGWLGAWRRIWPHPGIVERATPEDWPWMRRRLTYQIPPLRRRVQRRSAVGVGQAPPDDSAGADAPTGART